MTRKAEIMTLELAHAATETTWSVLLRFVSAWALYPEAMKAAQIQLDDVVGTDCLPNFEARPKLPQVEAICRGKALISHQVFGKGLKPCCRGNALAPPFTTRSTPCHN